MERLDLRHEKLKEIPVLPNGLQNFDCAGNKITKIENLPNGLQEFSCFCNQITKIENLPNSLQNFACISNQITKIENLPNGLQKIWFGGNPITMVDDLEISRFNKGRFELRAYQAIKRLQRRIRYRYNKKTNAAKVIQQGCYNWLYSAKCRDGSMGLMVARDIKELQRDFGMFK